MLFVQLLLLVYFSHRYNFFSFSLRGPEGTAASSTCAGGAQGGAMCNMNSQNCNSCGGRWCYKKDECHHFQCPARSDTSKAEMDLRNEKLCALQTKLKAKGYQINLQESSHYMHRGYATYESSIWPKPATCLRPLYDESSSESKMWQAYKEDVTPVYLTKYFNDDYNLAFLPNQKVASTSFTKYLTCKYGAWDETIMEMDNSDRKIVMAVRPGYSFHIW